MNIFPRPNSRYLWYDFTVRGKRYRGSTKETHKVRADKIAALKVAAAIKHGTPLDKKAPTLREYSNKFLDSVDKGRIGDRSRRYYHNGWRLLDVKPIAGMRMDQISKREIEKMNFPGSPSNGNNALRTLRHMFNMAREDKLIFETPKFGLFKEAGRSLRLNDEAERRLLPVAEQPLGDLIVVMRDTGLRNARELYPMRVEHVDFDARVITVPDSKTEAGKRFVPMTDRVMEILRTRCTGQSKGWVWQSRRRDKHIGAAMVNRRWVRAREAAGLPEDLVLYCARHDFGSYVLEKAGNLKAVMEVMGLTDVETAMKYQHPEAKIVRDALNARHIPRHTGETGHPAST